MGRPSLRDPNTNGGMGGSTHLMLTFGFCMGVEEVAQEYRLLCTLPGAQSGTRVRGKVCRSRHMQLDLDDE